MPPRALRSTLPTDIAPPATVPVAKGHPGNPMSWDDMRAKFDALVTPRLGQRGAALFDLVGAFGRGGVLAEMRAILKRL